ncbi:cell division protein FtsQ/DivIB [Aeromonas schubertii]|uniref:Cell division protein FtsQ n=1 Tax=Aeromonas schubertii TaxID=652 RepID=A0ABS7V8R0_9GAMM|nr:cell division protein FtsQ/DivIB [Aeromonas schubertii]KUE79537.1 cell division protein FtsQ [Aeromonas schubertii]MBZ6065437.1 cell division protein FtsQ/DivIB [Aeromonas schubertii]
MEARAQPRTKGGFLAGIIFFLLVIWGLYRCALNVSDWLTDANRLPMSELLLQGQHDYVKPEEVRIAVLDGAESRNFFELDVNAVQARLNALPWVAQVSVRKKWPNKIKVFLTEQTVASRWNGNRFLSKDGVIFKAPDRVKFPLVSLSGPDDQAKRVLEAYYGYQAVLTPKGFRIAKVNLTARHAWELTLEGGIQLFLGRSDELSRLQRFVDVFPDIQPRELIAYVDLRYDTGLAVGWKKNEEKVNDQSRR